MKELIKIDKSLELLYKDFNSQLEVLGSDTKEFHNALIDLSAKYPDHKELLQFIVFINDKLETNQTLFTEIVVDSFNELIKSKKVLVQQLIEDKENEKINTGFGFWAKIKTSSGIMKNIKIILTSLAIILIAAGVLISPEMFIEVLKSIVKIL